MVAERLFQKVAPAFKWWVNELSELMAPILKTVPSSENDTILISDGSDHLTISHVTALERRELAEVPPSPNDLRAAIENVKNGDRSLKKAELCFELHPNDVIATQHVRPASAARKLQQLAAMDLERTTPLSANEVFIAVEQKARDNDTIETIDHMAKRERIERVVGLCEQAGLELSALRPAGSMVNFLDIAAPRKASIGQPMRIAIAGALALSLTLGAFYYRQAAQIEQLEARIEQEQIQARQVSGDQQLAATKVEAYSFLQDQRASRISAVETWEAVSIALPDRAWLTSLSISGAEVRFDGFSPQAAQLVGALQNHPQIEDAALSSPITLDTRQGLERFSIIVTPAAPHGDS